MGKSKGTILKGLRIRKEKEIIKILGVTFKVNFSKTGVSFSLQRPGISLNVRENRVRITLSIPGTGISYIRQITLSKERIDSLREWVEKKAIENEDR